MARAQTRRSVSVSGELYNLLKAYADLHARGVSNVVEAEMRRFLKMPQRDISAAAAPKANGNGKTNGDGHKDQKSEKKDSKSEVTKNERPPKKPKNGKGLDAILEKAVKNKRRAAIEERTKSPVQPELLPIEKMTETTQAFPQALDAPGFVRTSAVIEDRDVKSLEFYDENGRPRGKPATNGKQREPGNVTMF